jgi:4-hydroxyphenylpyruvate dioxygenase
MHDNPIGTDGFEFVEFTVPDPAAVARSFAQLGFSAIARHRSKNVVLYRQGDINFILNMEPAGQPAAFRSAHGPSANAMAFRVKDAAHAYAEAIKRGTEPVETPIGPMELDIPAIKGIGGANLYLVDRYGAQTIYDVDFRPLADAVPAGPAGLIEIDHLTHNLARGNMGVWADYYERIFNFREIRYFDIEGQHGTGLFSKAMTSPCGKIRIPLNESQDDKSQIEEFLRDYRGEGIQHIALSTADIYDTIETLRARGVAFQTIPDTYYEGVTARVGDHGEDLARLKRNSILIDGRRDDLLLQIFTQNAIGPIFFEVIQRKGNQGFGEGNFKALFDSIELDQIRRGVLDVSP